MLFINHESRQTLHDSKKTWVKTYPILLITQYSYKTITNKKNGKRCNKFWRKVLTKG